jgi:hypothetical protein
MSEVNNPKLKTWNSLNEALMTANEELCRDLLKEEGEGKNRPTFKKRIHSRLNKVRADRERLELVKNLL